MRTNSWCQWFLVLSVTISVGCSGEVDVDGMLARVGASCTFEEDCESGLCQRQRCTVECTTHAECESTGTSLNRCGEAGHCIESCRPERVSRDGARVCLGGVEVSCNELDESYCDVCRDKCSGRRCVPGEGCARLSDVGESCLADSDCRTANCSRIAAVCRVPLEAECDSTNCDLCITNDQGWSYCSRECGSGIATCAGDRCLGEVSHDYFYCRPDCSSSCPGQCRLSSGGSTQYCAPRVFSDWTLTTVRSSELQPCRSNDNCSEGTCLDAPSCLNCYGTRGYCSGECAADVDCGTGGRCVRIPCSAGSTEDCGARCLPSCDSGSSGQCARLADASCRAVPAIAGGTATVCDPRNDVGEGCSNGADCTSGACSSMGRCIASGGAPNGSSCGAPADCASSNCQSGTCHGTALRGDRCTMEYDCSVGYCTNGICN